MSEMLSEHTYTDKYRRRYKLNCSLIKIHIKGVVVTIYKKFRQFHKQEFGKNHFKFDDM